MIENKEEADFIEKRANLVKTEYLISTEIGKPSKENIFAVEFENNIPEFAILTYQKLLEFDLTLSQSNNNNWFRMILNS